MGYKSIIEQAVLDIFSSMVFLDIQVPEGVEPAPLQGTMISGMIGLAGDLQGSVLIHLPDAVAIAITNAFLGLEINSVDEDVKDAIGELTNMVAGGIKFLIPEKTQDVELAIPSVVCGQGYSCEATGRFERTAMLFELASGRFIVELQVKASGGLSSR
jgi:chemotaxis protein CheX